MALNVERKITLWFFLALGITLYFMYLTFQSKIDYYKRGKWVKLSYDIQSEIQTINGYMQAMHIVSHHYSVTGKKEYLLKYKNALTSLNYSMHQFAALTEDNPKQKELINSLKALNQKKTGREQNLLAKGNFGQAATRMGAMFESYDEILMDSLRIIINMMNYEEDRVLEKRIMAQEAASEKASSSLTVFVCLFLLIVGIFYYLIINDTKKRRRTELQLAENEAFLKTVFDKTPDALLLANFETKLIESCNTTAAKMFGFEKPADLIGVFCPQLHKNSFGEEERAEVDETVKEKGVWEKDLEFRTKDGREFWGCATITAFRFNSRLHKYMHITDITERKNAEQQLKKSEAALKELNQSKDLFFSILAHDLRGPLSGLLGVSEYMTDCHDIISNDEMKEMTSTVHFTARKIYGLLNNLLDWARLQLGKMEYCPSNINLRSVAGEIIDLQTPNAANKNIKIINRMAGDLCVHADINMVATILRNLISNAIKFTERGGEIIVSAREIDGHVEIKVADSGVGMSEDRKNKMFRIDSVYSAKGTAGEEGSGLGLVLCRELVEKNNGTIWVNSEINKGTEFIFALPLAS